MTDLAPFIIVGITSGSLYALAALGLVLTYKTSGIFNFAHGAIAAAGTYVFYELRVQRGMPWPIAAIISVAVFSPLAAIILESLAARLSTQPTRAKVSATIALFLAVYGSATAIYGQAPRPFPGFLPTRGVFTVGIVEVGWDKIIIVALAAAAAGGLWAGLKFTRMGSQMRAVVDDPALLALGGTGPRGLRRRAWLIGSAFATTSGILLAPTLGLDALVLTLLVVQAFGAAAIGRFSNIGMTYAGALIVGVLGSVSTRYVIDIPNLAGLPPSIPFLVLFVVLLVTPKGRLVEAGTAARSKAPVVRQRPFRATLPIATVGLAAFALVPSVVGTKLPVFIFAVGMAIVFASLALLVGTSGQVSLCHAAFAAVGAATFARFHDAGLPWILALASCALVAIPVGGLIAIPAIRLSGLYLALATFGFGILAEKMFFPTSLLFGSNGSIETRRPVLGPIDLTSDTAFYYVALAILVATLLVVWAIRASRLGRLLRAMADSPTALLHHGADVNVTRVLVFCVSASLAAVGGAVLANVFGFATGTTFPFINSLVWLAVLIVSGSNRAAGAILAAALLVVAPEYLPQVAQDWQIALFGFGALAVILSTPESNILGRIRGVLVTATVTPRHFPRPSAVQR